MTLRQRQIRQANSKSVVAASVATDAARPARVWVCLAVIVATSAAYSGAITAPFDFDDLPAIVQNPTIRSLWPPTALFSTPQRGTAVSGRPIANYSFALNHAVNRIAGVDQRPDPDGPYKTVSYHAVNILLHLVCGALLFGILRHTLRRLRSADRWNISPEPFAAVVTSLWLLHPIQTEAVDYLVQRTELLVSALYLATLGAAIRAGEADTATARRGWYLVAILFCLAGMGTKEVMVTAPLMVVLYDRAFRWTSWREIVSGGRGYFYLALAATSAWSIALIAGGARAETTSFRTGIPWYQYLYSQAWAIPHYLRLTIWPHPLLHDYGMAPVHGFRGIPGLLLLVALGGVTVVAWMRANRWGWLGFLGAWFFLLLAPSSSVVPIRTEIAAERRSYLALAAVFVLAVIAVEQVRRRTTTANIRRQRVWMIGALGMLGTVLAIATFERSRSYNDPAAMWRDVVQRVPDNPRGYSGLGNALLLRDSTRLGEVEVLLRKAVALDSTYMASWTNLGDVLAREVHFGEAKQVLEHALSIEPGNFDVEDRLGRVLATLGESKRAIPYLERSAAYQPEDATVHVQLGAAYVGMERWDEATRTLDRVVRLNPERTDAMRYLGRALTESDRAVDALPILQEATRRDPRSALGFATLSLANSQLRQTTDAVEAAKSAAESAGDNAEVYILIGRAMLAVHRAEEAKRYFGAAVRLRPDDAESITGLGAAEALSGDSSHAIQLLRRALVLDPSYAPARQVLDLLTKPASP